MVVSEPTIRLTFSGTPPAVAPEAPYEVRVTGVNGAGAVFSRICKERGWILVGWDDAPADGYRLYIRYPNTLEVMHESSRGA